MAELKDEQIEFLEEAYHNHHKISHNTIIGCLLQLNKRPHVELPENIGLPSTYVIGKLMQIIRMVTPMNVFTSIASAKAILAACGYDIEEPEPEKMEPFETGGGLIMEVEEDIKWGNIVISNSHKSKSLYFAEHDINGMVSWLRAFQKKYRRNQAARE